MEICRAKVAHCFYADKNSIAQKSLHLLNQTFNHFWIMLMFQLLDFKTDDWGVKSGIQFQAFNHLFKLTNF